ncbi:hypothetical protein [Marinovum sp.]|uniref:hypothetical protein n=1 Tax=Marinovum sp. TaxID=2024839 RepID=UPI003A939D76
MRAGLVRRLLSALLLGALVLFVSVSGDGLPHEEAGAGHVHASEAEPAPDTPRAPGHCHPGLDCFVTVAFLVPPGLARPVAEASATYEVQHPALHRWRLWSDPPPPRPLS